MTCPHDSPTLGASNHSKQEREAMDYYATEPKAIDLLASKFDIPHRVWECACGGGSLSQRLKERGHEVVSLRHGLTRIYSKMAKKAVKSLLVSTLLLIFAASNQISDPKSLLHEGSVFCGHLTSLVEKCATLTGEVYRLGGNRVGYWKQPKVSANLNLTARSAAVLLLSNVKSN